MKNLRQTSPNASGQAMLITVVFAAILLSAIMVGFFVIQMGSNHQSASTLRTKSRRVALEGIAFAANQLSADRATWGRALANDFTGTDCNGSDLKSPTGARFKLVCSVDPTVNPGLQSYEVSVTAVALDPAKNPVRAVRAYLSQRTLGVDPPSGVHAAAALQLVNQPPSTTDLFPAPAQGSLNVDWGPIVCLDGMKPNSWVLTDPIDTQQYPRKFSAGGLTGAVVRSGTAWDGNSLTDGKEYWTNAHSFSPLILEPSYNSTTGYVKSAQTENNITPPIGALSIASPPLTPLTPTPIDCPGYPKCGYFETDTEDNANMAVFDGVNGDGTGGPYTVPPGSVVIVVGAARFGNVAIDNATFIITGNLIIDGSIHGGTGGQPLTLHVPITAGSEYPYQNPPTYPCYGQEGKTCASTNVFPSAGNVHFRGFLWVKGDMKLKNNVTWNMAGSLMVGDMTMLPGSGGQLEIDNGSTLHLAYDDVINHNILVHGALGSSATNQIKIVPDEIQDVPVF